jgi:chromosome segregation ATPase
MAGEHPEVPPSPETPSSEPHFDVVRRGFDPAQVVEHLKRERERSRDLEGRLARAVGELAVAREELEAARATPTDPMVGVSKHVVDLLHGFEEEIERQRRGVELEFTGMLAEARTEAAQLRIDAQSEVAQLRSEAQSEADQLRSEVQSEADQARGRADRLLREAREESTRVRSELEALREATLTEVRELRDRMRSSLQQLDEALTQEQPGRVIVLGDPERVPPEPQQNPPASS